VLGKPAYEFSNMSFPVADRRDDKQLMHDIAARDESALSSLFDRYAGLTFAVGRRVLENSDEAEDTLLEVFWEIWDHAGRYTASRSAPRTYLMVLTRSRAIDRKRRLVGRANLIERLNDQSPSRTEQAVEDFQPQQVAVKLEDRSLVINALKSLSVPQRQAVKMAYFDDLSHRQIAEQLDVPLGTIKTRVRAGLGQLRNCLQKHFPEPALEFSH